MTSNKKLPFELLEQIFKYLKNNGTYIEACLHMCRSWNTAAAEIFWCEKSIKLLPSKCPQFLDFLNHNPTFGQKIEYMKFVDEMSSYYDRSLSEEYLTGKSIISMCNSLVNIYVIVLLFTKDYLKLFVSQEPSEIILPNIKSFKCPSATATVINKHLLLLEI
jgi:hypothetical protein